MIVTLISLLGYLIYTGQTSGAFYLLIRVFVIMIILYKVVSPLVNKLLKNYISKNKSVHLEYMNNVLEGIPYSKQLAQKAWSDNKNKSTIRRISSFITDAILYNLHYLPPSKK